MPRKTKTRRLRPPTPNRSPTSWTGHLLTALLAAALGSGVTALVLRHPVTNQKAVPPVDSTLPTDAARVLGYWYEDHQDWPQAITLLTQAITGGIDNPDVRTDLGVAYFKSGQPQKALDQYVLAQSEDANHENSLFNQGVAYAQLGNFGQAVSVWQAYLRRFPKGQHVADAHALISQLKTHGTVPSHP